MKKDISPFFEIRLPLLKSLETGIYENQELHLYNTRESVHNIQTDTKTYLHLEEKGQPIYIPLTGFFSTTEKTSRSSGLIAIKRGHKNNLKLFNFEKTMRELFSKNIELYIFTHISYLDFEGKKQSFYYKGSQSINKENFEEIQSYGKNIQPVDIDNLDSQTFYKKILTIASIKYGLENRDSIK